MNTKKKLHPENSSRINTLTRSAWCVAALIFALCTAHAGELSRPGEVIDAGDSYALKDGSRVALQRVLHEVAIKHQSSKSAEPTLRDSGVNQNPLTPLVTVQSGRSNVVDIYYVEDLQAVDKLLNVQGDEISVFSVLMDSASKRRVIATDEIIVQFADGIGRQQAVAQFEPEGLDVLESPVPSAPRQYLVRIVSGADKHALARAGQVDTWQSVEWAQPNFLQELEFYLIPDDTLFYTQQSLRNTGQNGAVVGADVKATKLLSPSSILE